MIMRPPFLFLGKRIGSVFVPDADCLVYLPMQDTVGTVVKDLSGNGRDFTFGGAPTWRQTGAGFYYLEFDGSDDYLTRAEALIPATDYTLAIWVLMDTAGEGAYREIYAQDYTADGGLYTGITDASPAAMRIGGEALSFSAYNYPSYDAWHYMVLVKKTGASASSFYVDGVSVATGTVAFTPDVAGFFIGKQFAGAEYWDGGLDLFILSGRAWTAPEITSLYNSDRHLFGV